MLSASRWIANGVCRAVGAPGRAGGGDTVQTVTIITGPPNELVALIHNRTPVILPRKAWRRWLGEDEAGVDDLCGMLRPYLAELMRAYPIGRRVGNMRNNDLGLLAPRVA